MNDLTKSWIPEKHVNVHKKHRRKHKKHRNNKHVVVNEDIKSKAEQELEQEIINAHPEAIIEEEGSPALESEDEIEETRSDNIKGYLSKFF